MKLLYHLLLFTLFFRFDLDAEEPEFLPKKCERRAVIELCDHVIVTNSEGKIVQEKHSVIQDLKDNGHISEEVQKKLLASLQDKKSNIARFQPRLIRGVASTLFSKAKNGMEFLRRIEDEIGIRFYVLSPQEEMEVLFFNAKAQEPAKKNEEILAIGETSEGLAFSAKNGENFLTFQTGYSEEKLRRFLSLLRNEEPYTSSKTVNPISTQEVQELSDFLLNSLSNMPEWISQKLTDESSLIATGGENSIFDMTLLALGNPGHSIKFAQKQLIEQTEVQKVVDKYAEKSYADELLEEKNLSPKTLTTAIVLNAFMGHLGIKSFPYVKTGGMTQGLFKFHNLWKREFNHSAAISIVNHSPYIVDFEFDVSFSPDEPSPLDQGFNNESVRLQPNQKVQFFLPLNFDLNKLPLGWVGIDCHANTPFTVSKLTKKTISGGFLASCRGLDTISDQLNFEINEWSGRVYNRGYGYSEAHHFEITGPF